MDKQVILELQTNASDVAQALANAKLQASQLKGEMEKLKKQQADGTISMAEYVEQMGALEQTMTHVKDAQQAYTYELKNTVKQQKENEGSLKALRAELNNTLREFDSLSRAERESAKGKDLIKKIGDLTKEVKDAEYETQRFQRNVGNYPQLFGVFGQGAQKAASAVAGLTQTTGGLKGAIQGVGVQLKALLANPIVAIVAAVAAVLMKVWEAIKKNDDAMTAMQSLMGAFKPILDIVNKGFALLAGGIGKAAEVASKFVQGIVSRIPGLKKFSEANEDIVRSTDKLQDAERQYTVEHAKRENKKADLLNKSRQSEKYSAAERKKMLEEAMKLDEEDLKAKVTIAKEKLRLAKLEAKISNDTTDETKNKLAELEAAVTQAETSMKEGQRRTIQQLNNFNKEERQAAQQRAKARDEERKKAKEAVYQLTTDENKMREDAIIKQFDTAIELYKKNYPKDTETIKRLEEQKMVEVGKVWAGVAKQQADEARAKFEKLMKSVEKDVKNYNDAAAIDEQNQEKLALMMAGENEEAKLSIKREYAQRRVDAAEEEFRRIFELNEQYRNEGLEVTSDMELAQSKAQQALIDAQIAMNELNKKSVKTLNDTTKKSMQTLNAVGSAFSVVIDSISEVIDAAAGENERFNKFSIALAEAQILVNTAMSIANAIQGATAAAAATGPGAPIATPIFIAEMVGIVASAIGASVSTLMKAKNESPKYAVGGYVQGAGTGTSDSIDAKLSNGEFVVNARSTREHLAELVAINGGWGNTSRIPRFANGGYVDVRTRQMAIDSANNAELKYIIENIPAPVVSVKEITNTQKKVQVKEQLARR